jgi:hypothetical protein
MINSNALLLLDGARGRYIPRDFEYLFRERIVNPHPNDAEYLDELKEPDSDTYWDAWNNVFDLITLTIEGKRYTLAQDEGGGNLWAVPFGEPFEIDEEPTPKTTMNDVYRDMDAEIERALDPDYNNELLQSHHDEPGENYPREGGDDVDPD